MCIFIFGKGGGSGSGPDLSKVTARPEYVLSPYKYVDKGGVLRQGTISNFAGEPAEGAASGDHFTINPSTDARHIPAGSYLGRAIDLPAMPQGSVTGAQLDDHSFRITKTAGYIEGGTQDFAISGREIAYFTISSVASRYDRFSVYAEAPNVLEKLSNMFAVDIIAMSASSGQVAAASFAKGGDGSWTANVYVIGVGYLSPEVALYMGPEGQYYVRFDITIKDFNGFSQTAVYTGRCWYWY